MPSSVERQRCPSTILSWSSHRSAPASQPWSPWGSLPWTCTCGSPWCGPGHRGWLHFRLAFVDSKSAKSVFDWNTVPNVRLRCRYLSHLWFGAGLAVKSVLFFSELGICGFAVLQRSLKSYFQTEYKDSLPLGQACNKKPTPCRVR